MSIQSQFPRRLVGALLGANVVFALLSLTPTKAHAFGDCPEEWQSCSCFEIGCLQSGYPNLDCGEEPLCDDA